MSRSGWSRHALLAALTVGLVGCVAGDLNELEEQRAAWESVRPAHYSYEYTGTGFSPLRGPWRIEVRGEEAVAVTRVDGSNPGFGELAVEYASSIDELFDSVAGGLKDSDLDVDVEYDPQWHFPADAYFDIGEEGSGFRAGNLTPLED